MVYCVHSLESPRWGDSNENTQHTFFKIEKLFLLCHLTWRYNQPSLARIPLSRTNFQNPKGVRAIEVLLYIVVQL